MFRSNCLKLAQVRLRPGKAQVAGVLSAALLVGICGVGAVSAQAQTAKKPLGNVTVGWTYLYADEGGYRSNLNGWFARPQLNLKQGWSVFFDSTNYYGTNKKGSVNGHGYTAGFGKTLLRKHRLKPTLFAESGDVRTSSAGTITEQFAFAAGASFAYSLNHEVSLVVTPAEWVFLYPNGDPRNDYNSKAGLVFNF